MQIARFLRVPAIDVTQRAFASSGKRAHGQRKLPVTHCTIMFYLRTDTFDAANSPRSHLRHSSFTVL